MKHLADNAVGGRRPWVAGFCALLVAAATCLMGAEKEKEPQEFINEDTVIQGQTARMENIGGQNVLLVTGGLSVTVGQRSTISADQGVIWVQSAKSGGAETHDMSIFAEGNVKVLEPRGVTVTDKKNMVIPLHTRGRVRLPAQVVEGQVAGTALYERGLVERRAVAAGGWRIDQPVTDGDVEEAEVLPEAAPAGKPRKHAPRLVEVDQPDGQDQPATGGSTSKPAKRDRKVRGGLLETAVDGSTTKPAGRSSRGAYTRIRFDAEGRIDSQIEKDPTDLKGRKMRRVTTAQKNVIITAYDPEGRAMELTCQNAVIFTEKLPPKSARIPWAPKMGGVATDLPGPAGYKESLRGVYLSGDVVIRRGERVLRAPEAFYDFAKDRAIIPHAVMRTVVEARNIPLVVRASELRELSSTEVWAKDAQLSTSDFATPEYAINPRVLYLKDQTPRDETGVKLGEKTWLGWMQDLTFRVRDVPIFYAPYGQMDMSEGNTALRSAKFGSFGHSGAGMEIEWDLYRFLGLIAPEGYRATLDTNWYQRAFVLGVNYDYLKENYSGYGRAYGVLDSEGEDDLGRDRDNIDAPSERGRVLMRHKHMLPGNWEAQLELSYLSDRNFLESFFRDEFEAGKDQETLAYFKKQGGENWAITGLLQGRINDFQTQTESYPDLSFWVTGQPLAGDAVNYYGEHHAGLKRWMPDDSLGQDKSDVFARGDTRNEIDFPFRLGPVNVRPYATGRATYWGDTPAGDADNRLFGQVGVQTSTTFWRTYNDAKSRMWDVNGLRHIVTPVAAAWATGSNGAEPADVFALDPGVEQDVNTSGGVAFGALQTLQTKRGPAGKRSTVDWMKLDAIVGLFDKRSEQEGLAHDGTFIFHRPESSLPRDYARLDYTWQVSDSVLVQAGTKYDLDSTTFAQSYAGVAVQRDPRMRYYFGGRYLHDVDSLVLTGGFNYKISEKYSVSVFEQYDTLFDGGRNLATSVTLIRKFPRWYTALTVQYDASTDNLSVFISLWPEGVPEVKFAAKNSNLLGGSSEN